MNRLIGLLAILLMFFSGCAARATSNLDGSNQPMHSQEPERKTTEGGGY
jgi:hypothetical protein